MLFIPDINASDLFFLLIPLVLGCYFFLRSAKTEHDRDKFIMFILSMISFIVWGYYAWKFLNNFTNKLLYG